MEIKSNVMYTIEQVAEILSVSTDTVYRLIRTGALNGCRIGGFTRVMGADVLAFYEENQTRPVD